MRTSFAVSACLHGSVLAWVMFSAAASAPRPKTLYEQEIKPNQNKIVWYRLSEKLPEISPPEAREDRRPLRAAVKQPQVMVSGAKDMPNPAPKIWMPEPPPVTTPKPVPLPNMVAVAPPKVLRRFVPPPDLKRQQAAPKLAEPPKVEAKVEAKPLPMDVSVAKPAPRAFVPPPSVRLARQAALPLPESPETHSIVVEPNALPFGPVSRPRKEFAPASKAGPAGAVAVAAPPDVETKPIAETTMAIVGLNPSNTIEVPAPPAPNDAGFSAGPTVRKEGPSTSGSGMTLLNVPGLTVRGGPKDTQPTLMAPFSPTSRENLVAAARTVGGAGVVVKSPSEARPARVSEAPDPRLAGRVIYTMAIQMPNVTSYSGSWMVWFAEREPLPGAPALDMKAPAPLRKVDPKYVAAAVADRVEGMVRLAAVIRKDGRVDTISLLHHLDVRLDETAQEALAKWEFTPALRNGKAVDVDAVFEIPFHLAPRVSK